MTSLDIKILSRLRPIPVLDMQSLEFRDQDQKSRYTQIRRWRMKLLRHIHTSDWRFFFYSMQQKLNRLVLFILCRFSIFLTYVLFI